MSQHDKEIGLGDIDQVSVDHHKHKKQGAAPVKPAAARVKASPGSTSSAWMLVSAVLLVLVLVISLWFYRELSQLQGQFNNEISESSEQLDGLASQLSATDETLGHSEQQVQETFAFHESEIRKLWDVSNKRNKAWIQENKSLLASLKKQLSALKESSGKTAKSLGQLAVHAERSQTRLDVLAESLKQVDDRVQVQQGVLDQVEDLLPVLERLVVLEQEKGNLDEQMAELHEVVRSFDIYRRETNERLLRLEAK